MKKVIVLCAIAVSLLTGCYKKGDTYSANGVTKTYISNQELDDLTLLEYTYEGKTHQFLRDRDGLAHWPDCKYCKKEK